MSDQDSKPQAQQDVLSLGNGDDEYEVISSDEVDRVLEVLDQLIEGVDSENIRAHLEDAADDIYALVYSEECAEDQASGESAEAA